VHHRLSGLATYGLKGQCAGDELPTYTPLEYGPSPFIVKQLFELRLNGFVDIHSRGESKAHGQ